ncbi:MAG: IS91 family transposase, partial [Gammaproteobacteria bacterium]|nr:IS91 family transposase [Gammaproteobacteria bacterium]
MTLIQRFGSALNLNVHLHMIVPDGVYTMEHNQPRFHRVNAPDRQNLDKLLNRIIARVMRRLIKDGLRFYSLPSRHRPRCRQQNTHLEEPGPAAHGDPTKTLHGRQKRFFTERVACQPHQRDRLERLCRYVTRPAVCLERLSTNAAGQVSYELKHPFRDGTTHI